VKEEAGETLIEIMISVVILATVMVAVLGGMGSTHAAGGTHRRQAEAMALLLASAERVKSAAEVDYVNCATPSTATYLSAAQGSSLPSGSVVSGNAVTITSIAYWNGSAFTSTCSDVDTPRLRLQQITLTANAAKVSEEITIIKRGTP
jgi:Tfp pilus assembly protein PilV